MDKRYGSWEDEQPYATECTKCGSTFSAGQGWVYGTALNGGIQCDSCRKKETWRRSE